jgi:molybdopterin converting factor small subunit
MKTLTVKLFAYFREDRFLEEVRQYPDTTSVLDIIQELNIDPEDVGVTMINSRHCDLDQLPQEGDLLAIFPVIGGG